MTPPTPPPLPLHLAPCTLQLRIVTQQGLPLAVDDLPLPPAPASGPPSAHPPSSSSLGHPLYQLVPSLPSTTVEATSAWSRWGACDGRGCCLRQVLAL